MRRLGLASGGLALIALCFLSLSSRRSPFTFLDGHEELFSVDEVKYGSPGTTTYYSFEADYPKLKRLVISELMTQSYEDTRIRGFDGTPVHSSNETLSFSKGNWDDLRRWKPGSRKPHFVHVDVDRDRRSQVPAIGAQEPLIIPASGWVTVIIREERERGLLERFRGWIGW